MRNEFVLQYIISRYQFEILHWYHTQSDNLNKKYFFIMAISLILKNEYFSISTLYAVIQINSRIIKNIKEGRERKNEREKERKLRN